MYNVYNIYSSCLGPRDGRKRASSGPGPAAHPSAESAAFSVRRGRTDADTVPRPAQGRAVPIHRVSG